MSEVISIQAKPVAYQAIQWIKNESDIRRFVGNDAHLRFPAEGRLEVFNDQEQSWMNVPLFHYVVVGIMGELFPISIEVLQRSYEVVIPQG